MLTRATPRLQLNAVQEEVPMETLADRVGEVARCRGLVADYLRAIDSGRATAAIDAFAEDADFEAHGQVFRGHAEIRGFLTRREADTARQTAHVLANEVVTRHDDGGIELRALLLLHVRQPDGSYRLDRVLDTVHQFRNGGGGWRIARRTATPLHPTA